MKKTLNFASIHFLIAFTVGYVVSGDILIGSLFAMIEPTLNTVAFHLHEKGVDALKPNISVRLRSASFAVVHFAVAFGVVYLLTGDALAGGLVAVLEPALTCAAYYVHEHFWRHRGYHNCATC